MVIDPHSVLGVSPGASQDEIKRAYRQKAKECHPDLHPDDPNATAKMNEINEAYDMLMHPEKYQARQQQQQRQTYQNQGYNGQTGGGYGQQQRQGNPYGYGQQGWGGWQSSGGWFDFEDVFGFGGPRQAGSAQPPREEAFDSQEIRLAVRAVNAGRYQEAVTILQRIPSTGRDAQWHYLFGLSQAGAGNTMTAQEEMQRAVQMDPNNPLYHQLLQQYRQAGQTYTENSRGFNMSAMDPTRWCMTCLMANLLCNCCCRCI